jgi:hypothetical protein
MMSNDVSQGGIQVNRSLLVGGGLLVGIGGLLGFAGMVLVGSALLSATRQWVNQLEQPPQRDREAQVAAGQGRCLCRYRGMAERTSDPIVSVLGKRATAVVLTLDRGQASAPVGQVAPLP